MTVGARVFDAGLQAERTALAWRRTALALAVAALGAARLAAPVVGPAALVLGALGLVLAGAVAASSGRRYRSVHTSLLGRGDLRGLRRPAVPIAALAGTGVTVGVLALCLAVAG